MKVRVIDELCQGHAMCLLACPELFRINDDDGHAYLASSDVPDEHQEGVRQAQRGCPEAAIEIED